MSDKNIGHTGIIQRISDDARPGESVRMCVSKYNCGIWLELLDNNGDAICAVALDYHDGKASALVVDEAAMLADTHRSFTLCGDVQAAIKRQSIEEEA